MHPIVPLSQVATPVTRPVVVTPGTSYRTIGVKWWGEGVYERSTIDGSQTAARRLSTVRKDDLIINKIWVRHGSIAVVPSDIDGCVGSNEFPTFRLDCHAVLPRWVHWLTKTKAFWDECAVLSRGTSGKDRIRPELFLTVPLPLPPLDEQHRIVARIEDLAKRIEHAQQLREQVVADARNFLAAAEFRIWPRESLREAQTLGEVTTYLTRGRQAEQGESKHYLVKTQHVQMGLCLPSTLTLAPHAAAKVALDAVLRDGDILIACSAAGCLGRVARFHNPDGRTASTDTHVAAARANPGVIDPDYLYCYLVGATGQIELRSRERGDWTREKVGFRLTELNLSDLSRVPVPTPSLEEQRRIAAYIRGLHHEISALRTAQSETAAELDALLPSILDKAFKGKL